MSLSITTITETGSLSTSFNVFLFDASLNDITFTMNDITGNGINYIFKRIDSSDEYGVTLQGFDSGQTINGQVSIAFGVNQSCRIISYNGTWITVY